MARFRNLGKTVQNMVGALLAPAEDPRVAYAGAYQQHDALVAQVRHSIQQLAGARTRSCQTIHALREALPVLEEQARAAIVAGQEELARVILKRRQLGLAELELLEGQLREIEVEEQRLMLAEHRIVGQVEYSRSRLEVAQLRSSALRAQVQVGEALAGVSSEWETLGRTLAEAEGRAEYLEARAAAIDSLIQRGTLDVVEEATGADERASLSHGDPHDPVERYLETIKSSASGEAGCSIPAGDQKV